MRENTHTVFWGHPEFPYATGSVAYFSDEHRGWLAPEYGNAIRHPIATLPIGMPDEPVAMLAALREEYAAAMEALHRDHLKKAVAELPWLATLPQYKGIA